MAIENPRNNKLFFSYREATAGTPDTNCFFESRAEQLALPEAEYQFESDKGKMGSGEFGTATELQAAWTSFSITCKRLSEVSYFLSYFQGKIYGIDTSGALERHELWHLGTNNVVLPTFTMEHGPGGTGNNTVYSGCMVNDFTITLSNTGNGVVEATFNCFGNRHRFTAGAIAATAAGNMDTADAAFSFASEPYINYRMTSLWMADAVDDNLKASSVDFSGEDLGANVVTLSTLLNSITFTGNHNITIGEMARAGSGGVINTFEKSDTVYNVNMNIRKDDSNIATDTMVLANTKQALEIQFAGKYISGTDPYGIDIFFPVVQVISGPEQDGSPIDKEITFEVFEDSTNTACDIFVQSEVSVPYNSEN